MNLPATTLSKVETLHFSRPMPSKVRSQLLYECRPVVMFSLYRCPVPSPTKQQNFDCFSSCRYCRSARVSPNSVITVFQILSKSVRFRGSCCRTHKHRFCPVEYFHNSPEAMFFFARIISLRVYSKKSFT